MCAIAAAIIHRFTACSTDLEVERSLALESDEQVVALAKQKEDLELQILDLEERLDEEQEVNAKLSETKRKLEQQVDQLRQQLAEETVNVERLQVQQACHFNTRIPDSCVDCLYQADKAQRDGTIRDLEQELSEVSGLSSRLNKEKKAGKRARLVFK